MGYTHANNFQFTIYQEHCQVLWRSQRHKYSHVSAPINGNKFWIFIPFIGKFAQIQTSVNGIQTIKCYQWQKSWNAIMTEFDMHRFICEHTFSRLNSVLILIWCKQIKQAERMFHWHIPCRVDPFQFPREMLSLNINSNE